MNLVHKNLFLVFLVTLLLSLTFPVLFPSFRLSFFIPFIIILFYQKPLYICLWGSFICGTIIDLFSWHQPYGLFALTFCVTTVLLYGQKRHFFTDSITTLPIMTFFFSLLATIIQVLVFYVFEQHPLLSWKWFFTDLILLPGVDALYAFSVFILPFFLAGKKPLKGKDYFMEQ